MPERNEWNLFFVFAAATGLLMGLTASLLPQSFFYETALYYSRYAQEQCGVGNLMHILLENMQDLVYFLSIRLFLPFFLLIIGLLKRNTILPQVYILLELASLSLQAVLIFASTGMEGWFRYQLISFLPEGCYILAAFRIYFFKKREAGTAQSIMLCVFQTFLLLLCGIVLEILIA